MRLIDADALKEFAKEKCSYCTSFIGEESVLSWIDKAPTIEPSGDLINRAEAIEAVESLPNTPNGFSDTYDKACIIELLKDIPSVDRPKGEWLDEDGDKVEIDDNGITECSCWCSVCGEWLVASDEYPTKGNFCPNCGADMRGEK